MVEGQRGRRNILQILNDSELMKRYRFDCAWIMLVVDLIKDVLTSPTQCNNNGRNESDHNTKIFGNWKNETLQQC